jgi:hypothetical protein
VVGVPAADPRGCRRNAAKMNPSPALAEGFPFARNLVAAARRAECRWAIARPLKTARAMARTHRSHLLHLLHAVAIAPAHLRPALHDLGRGVRRPARLWGSGTSRLDGTRLAWRPVAPGVLRSSGGSTRTAAVSTGRWTVAVLPSTAVSGGSVRHGGSRECRGRCVRSILGSGSPRRAVLHDENWN